MITNGKSFYWGPKWKSLISISNFYLVAAYYYRGLSQISCKTCLFFIVLFWWQNRIAFKSSADLQIYALIVGFSWFPFQNRGKDTKDFGNVSTWGKEEGTGSCFAWGGLGEGKNYSLKRYVKRIWIQLHLDLPL